MSDGKELVMMPSTAAAAFQPVMDIAQALERRNNLVAFVSQILVQGEDYGKIPGSNKNTLFKPGAEKLSSFFGLEPHFHPIEEDHDILGDRHQGEAFYYIRYRCTLKRGNTVVGMGEGSCNSWESKYRYRWVPEEQVPSTMDKAGLPQQDGTRRHTEFDFALKKRETTGQYGKPAEYWRAFEDAMASGSAVQGTKPLKSGKVGTTFTISIGARLFRIPNPDISDSINTIQKMAQKRAYVAATLTATGASQFFTQDLEDTVGAQAPPPRGGEPLDAEFVDAPPPPPSPPAKEFSMKAMLGEFSKIKENMRHAGGSDEAYYRVLGTFGCEHANDLRDRATAVKVYAALKEAHKDLTEAAELDHEKGGE